MKIAIFYPHGDILERKGGASRRAGYLIDFLKERCSELLVITTVPGVVFEDVVKGNVRYTCYRQPPRNNLIIQNYLRRFYGNVLSFLSHGMSRSEDLQLWKHYEYCIDPSFVRYASGVVEWADVIFLKYTYLAWPVARIARHKKKPVIITSYDILADQVQKVGWLKKMTFRAEARALKKADLPVCVSEADRKLFSGHGVKAEVIPHSIDFERHDARPSNDDCGRLLSETAGNIPIERVCLFVGTPHPPNLAAVNDIRRIAGLLLTDDKERRINFIVAGECYAPGREDNFYSLGRVSDEVLSALYQIADVVLVPLPSGTGASVKTIEAMGRGKVVLGTNVGFRGYPVESGVNCLVSGNIDEYPGLIAGLFRDEPRRLSIAANAREFAKAYDYRRVYRRYAEFIEKS